MQKFWCLICVSRESLKNIENQSATVDLLMLSIFGGGGCRTGKAINRYKTSPKKFC